MYVPIPGLSHLKLYVAPERIRYQRTPTALDLKVRDDVAGKVRIILEVAAGLRPPRHIERDHFPPELPVHLRAWMRTHSGPGRALELITLHARANGEFYGTARIGEHQHAFTGASTPGRVSAFRMLAPIGGRPPGGTRPAASSPGA